MESPNAPLVLGPVWEALHTETLRRLADCGTWWSGPQQRAVLEQVRAAPHCVLCQERRDAVSPSAVDGEHEADTLLPATAVDVIHRLTTDPGRLTRAWADAAIAELGEEAYVELVASTSSLTVVDRFADGVDQTPLPLPDAGSGQPTCERPDQMGDTGAWVAQDIGPSRANVSRAVSLVPAAHDIWRTLVDQHYSRGAGFLDLTWDRALTRPQVETVAAEVSRLNECFY
ncbi:MAG: hypothetical protein GY929_23645 [Actinomycetia bacterium]|nr:hypothetical protein [Actinomycetes bacterium]